MSYTSCEIKWLVTLLHEIGFYNDNSPMSVLQLNSLAIAIAKNLVSLQRMKHIEINIHTIRDQLLWQELYLEKVNTRLNVANLFTKPIVGALFRSLLHSLGMVEIHKNKEINVSQTR